MSVLDAKAKLRALYESSPKTDREMVAEAKEEITLALSRERSIVEIYDIMRESGFKGNRRKFTEILQELGLWTIRVGHRKPVVNTTRLVETPANPATTQTPAEESTSSPNYRIDSNGTKIWGGKKNNNPASAPAKKPVEDDKSKNERPAGAITQEELEKEFGSKGFW